MTPKDKDTKLQKSGVIYKYKCPQINGPEEYMYIGETGRALWDKLKEHLRPHPPSTNIPAPWDIQSVLTVLT